MKNTILLRRKNKVVLEKGNYDLPLSLLATALKNLEDLGYTFSDNLIETLKTLSEEEFMAFYTQTVTDIKVNIGGNVVHRPMYPNFPQEVMDAEEAELYVNAFLQYLLGIMPESEKKERFPLFEETDVKVIDLATEDEFTEMIRNLMAANTSISATDKEDVCWAIANYEDVSVILPEEMPLKENIAFVVHTLLQEKKASVDVVAKYFSTATDVLRFVVALSDGDVSLSKVSRFKKLSRSERRLVMGLLENCGFIIEDMVNNKEIWKRLGKNIHPYEYKNKYPNAVEAFDVVLNDKPFVTFGGKVEKAIQNKNVIKAVDFLKKRPGNFARKLDELLRLAAEAHSVNSQYVVEAFDEVAGEVATPVLLQVMTHFKHRNEKNDVRVFFPKGNVSKAVLIDNLLTPIDESVTNGIVMACEKALKQRFAQLSSLGNVVLDEELKNYMVPFSQRSASKSLRTLVRGSSLDLPEGDTVRFFLWWKEGKKNGEETGRVDIDMSTVAFDENFRYKQHISYTNLTSNEYRGYHSGDIVSAPKGASEFIDIDIPSYLKMGTRYVVMSVYSYTGQPFSTLPECFAGWMSRKDSGSGEIYEPKTVKDKFDIASESRTVIPVVLDLVERKAYWVDLALNSHPDFYTYNSGNNVESNRKGLADTLEAVVKMRKTNLYDLFRLHAEARGVIVERPVETEEENVEELVEEKVADTTAEVAKETVDSEKAEQILAGEIRGDEAAELLQTVDEEAVEEKEELVIDTIFSVEEGITPFDIEKIMAEFMA